MKKINLWYWIVTIIFAAFMLFSGITNAMVTEDSIALITTGLGYPKYFIAFIGVAKVIGAIAILIPSFRRIKEWAYAGLFFDLLAATYSLLGVQNFAPSGKETMVGLLFMVVTIGFLFLSYYLWHKKIGTV